MSCLADVILQIGGNTLGIEGIETLEESVRLVVGGSEGGIVFLAYTVCGIGQVSATDRGRNLLVAYAIVPGLSTVCRPHVF